jgi:hypothetical protein
MKKIDGLPGYKKNTTMIRTNFMRFELRSVENFVIISAHSKLKLVIYLPLLYFKMGIGRMADS